MTEVVVSRSSAGAGETQIYVPPMPEFRSPESNRRYARIAAVIPAYNEEDSIGEVIQSLLDQTRAPDAIFVIVNNSTDDTFIAARRFEGVHTLMIRDQDHECVVRVVDIGKNIDKKVGALNYGWRMAKDFDYILGVDGDTTLHPKCVKFLEDEIVSDSRIGGISAVYSFHQPKSKDPIARFLVTSQKFQFAGFNMDNLLRNRNMAVLGGQCSLLSTAALKKVMERDNQSEPWVRDSEVEDSLLSLQLKNAGFQTKISAKARAYVGPMETLSSLHKQQIKWTAGAAELLLTQPFHTNLRLRWRENLSMLFNIVTRLGFIMLVLASLSIDAFVFQAWWLIFPALAAAVNTRLAFSMHNRTLGDILYAVLLVPSEAYMMLRMSHFTSSWAKVLGKQEYDAWGAQSAAEQGKGTIDFLYPIIVASIGIGALMFWWTTLSIETQTLWLSIGWPVLATITIVQGLFLLKRVTRRQRGFRV